MNSLRMSLVDNDYVVRARTDLDLNGNDDRFAGFLKSVHEELVTGKTALLKLESSETGPITLEVSKYE
jgi:hypothetical protein